jgi:hypothetical protein
LAPIKKPKGCEQDSAVAAAGVNSPSPAESVKEPEVTLWVVEHAPEAIKKAFPDPLPPNAWIMKLSSQAIQDIELEAYVQFYARTPLIGRVQLDDGGIALLFAP